MNLSNINPLSGYDILYKGMSEEDRDRLRADITVILEKSATDAEQILLKGIQKAVTEMYDARQANPWINLLNDCNADAYGFLTTLADNLWEQMLKCEPVKFASAESWKLHALIEVWKIKYPEQLAEIANKELVEQNKKLQEQLDFLQQVRQMERRY